MKEIIDFRLRTFNVESTISIQYIDFVFDHTDISLSLWELSSTTSDYDHSRVYFVGVFSDVCFSFTIGYFTGKNRQGICFFFGLGGILLSRRLIENVKKRDQQQ